MAKMSVVICLVIASLVHLVRPLEYVQPTHPRHHLQHGQPHPNSVLQHEPGVSSLGCVRRLYTHLITQVDSRGRECKDHVSVWSCWGRCDSKEISDWKFPYKRSYHPVCVHAGRAKAEVMLRNCHPDVDPETRRYEYMEAIGCHCQTCSTTDTSCEAPNHNEVDESSVKVLALAGPSTDDLDY